MNQNYPEINDTLLIGYIKKTNSVEENSLVENWMNLSAENEAQFESLKLLWETTSITEDFDTIKVDESWKKVKKRITEKEDPKVRKIDFSILWKVAVAVIVLIGISLPSFLKNDTTLIADSTKEFYLPDGTQVWLKKGSELTYNDNFNTTIREVTIEGEGYFNVEKNKEKPFIVHLDNTTTTVLGTQFNIKNNKIENTTSLVLIEGSVQFSNKTAFKIIKPGETVTASSNGTLSIKATKNINFDSWKTKKLQFNKTALATVIADIENAYETKIILENKELYTCKLTSTFTNQSLDQIIETLTLLYQFSKVKEGDTISLINGRCSS